MAYIKVRKQSDGSTRYTAIVRLRRGKAIVHQEARTFAHRVAAITWAKHREVVLEDPSTLAELIRWYIDTFESISFKVMMREKSVLIPDCRHDCLVVKPLPIMSRRGTIVLTVEIMDVRHSFYAHLVARKGNPRRDRRAVTDDLPPPVINQSIKCPSDQQNCALEHLIQVGLPLIKFSQDRDVESRTANDHLTIAVPAVG